MLIRRVRRISARGGQFENPGKGKQIYVYIYILENWWKRLDNDEIWSVFCKIIHYS